MPIESEVTWTVSEDGTRFVLGRPFGERRDHPTNFHRISAYLAP
jgi:hypothetical protein